MDKPRDIAIVGYGTAGQALAVLLTRDGHRVQVFEQAAQPGPVGAGFLLQPSGLQVLWQMQLLPQVLAHGAVVRRLYGDTPCGRAVMDMRYAGLDARLYGVGMQRGALFTLLDEAWQARNALHVDSRIVAIDDGLQRVQDRHGRWHGPFDLVIATDGSASSLRAQVCGTRLDRPYPWGALWCLLPAGDWASSCACSAATSARYWPALRGPSGNQAKVASSPVCPSSGRPLMTGRPASWSAAGACSAGRRGCCRRRRCALPVATGCSGRAVRR